MILEINWTYSITDLIQAIGISLGFPAAAWGIIQLFRKDKDKESQLNSLNDIAISQNSLIRKMTEQINELSKQTAQFEYQSLLFKESNELLKEQIKLQNDSLISGKEHNEKNLELDKKKRKSEIRPFFKYRSVQYSGNTLSLFLGNFGERAYLKEIEEIDTQNGDIQLPPNFIDKAIENNQPITFTGFLKHGRLFGVNTEFEVNLKYVDEDHNLYKQNIKSDGSKFIIGNPEEIEDS